MARGTYTYHYYGGFSYFFSACHFEALALGRKRLLKPKPTSCAGDFNSGYSEFIAGRAHLSFAFRMRMRGLFGSYVFGSNILTISNYGGNFAGLGKTMDQCDIVLGALKTALTWYLTALPQLHIRGAALATVVGLAFPYP